MCFICGVISCFETRTTVAAVVDASEDVAASDDLPFIEVQQSGHSVAHYEDTKHVYAQMIES